MPSSIDPAWSQSPGPSWRPGAGSRTDQKVDGVYIAYQGGRAPGPGTSPPCRRRPEVCVHRTGDRHATRMHISRLERDGRWIGTPARSCGAEPVAPSDRPGGGDQVRSPTCRVSINVHHVARRSIRSTRERLPGQVCRRRSPGRASAARRASERSASRRRDRSLLRGLGAAVGFTHTAWLAGIESPVRALSTSGRACPAASCPIHRPPGGQTPSRQSAVVGHIPSAVPSNTTTGTSLRRPALQVRAPATGSDGGGTISP